MHMFEVLKVRRALSKTMNTRLCATPVLLALLVVMQITQWLDI